MRLPRSPTTHAQYHRTRRRLLSLGQSITDILTLCSNAHAGLEPIQSYLFPSTIRANIQRYLSNCEHPADLNGHSPAWHFINNRPHIRSLRSVAGNAFELNLLPPPDGVAVFACFHRPPVNLYDCGWANGWPIGRGPPPRL